jgi:hypothetical protein
MMRRTTWLLLLFLLAPLVVGACPSSCDGGSSGGGEGEGEGEGEGSGEGEGEGEGAPGDATATNLRWRTGFPLERQLQKALALTEAEVCNELGRFKCVTRPQNERPFRPGGSLGNPVIAAPVPHLVALGGNDPFDINQYEARREPGATTPVALDRVVLAACDARLQKDLAGEAVVFGALDLQASAVQRDDPAVVALVADLYRRFHMRTPTASESELARGLALDDDGQAVAVADFALAVCFAVGATSEMIFD